MKFLAFLLIAVLAAAQTVTTTIKIRQLATASSPNGTTLVTLPNGIALWAVFDPAGFTIDQSVNPPVLRTKTATPVLLPVDIVETIRVAADTPSVTLRSAPRSKPAVFLNGLLQAEDVDYRCQGSTISFLTGVTSGDILQFRYAINPPVSQ